MARLRGAVRAAIEVNRDDLSFAGVSRGIAKPPELDVPAEAVTGQLEKILASPSFRASEGLSRFLRFIVEQTLVGHGDWLKESVVGVEVFKRGKAFDPRMDAIVRVDARRLRTRLAEYYATAGKSDPILIEVRKGSYAPSFSALPASGALRMQAIHAPSAVMPCMDADSRFSSIAVLPFISLSSDPDNEYFSDGLTEEVIAALTRIPLLRVIARSTAFRYQGKAHDIGKVGAELHVEAVLEGSVRKTGDRLRISAQLIDVSTSFHIWSRTFEGDTRDIFAVQREISDTIAGMVKTQVPSRRSALTLDRPRNVHAYDLYLRGIFFESQRTGAGITKGIDYLRQAIALDPDCAAMQARLADSLALQCIFGMQAPETVMPSARDAAAAAIDLDDHLAEAHAARALVSALYEWDWAAAERGFRRALLLNPGIPEIHHRYAIYYLVPQGRLGEALEEIRQARNLDPLSLVLNATECAVLYWSRQYDEAIDCAKKTLDQEPNHSLTYTYLISSYQEKGMLDEALDAAEIAVRLSSGSPFSLRQLGTTYARMGRREEALAVVEELQALTCIPAVLIADIFTALEDNCNAFVWLEKARSARSPILMFTRIAPSHDALRLDPRFALLMKKIGFETPVVDD